MSDPFVAEIRMFGCNFAPTGWALCNGQLLPISQNTALFSLLGTFYGGDGKSTFALPNLQGSVAIGQGQGTGLSQRFVGEQSGIETVTLLQTEIPSHNHGFNALTTAGAVTTSNNSMLGKGLKGNLQASVTAKMYSTGTANTTAVCRTTT
jgi:microcystin-dependent protein